MRTERTDFAHADIPDAEEYRAALERLVVGVTHQSTPRCDHYEGLQGDALDEAADILAREYGRPVIMGERADRVKAAP